MSDLIDRQAAIKAIEDLQDCYNGFSDTYDKACIIGVLEELPSAQPEQTVMIKEIREWINSGNRGNADYFIVDKIEEIINKYE